MSTVSGHAEWHGSFKEGVGTLSTRTTSTVARAPYTYASRFEGAAGAIPEELLVTGHAGCYNHALANIAQKAGFVVEFIDTTAELTMGTDDQGTDGHGYSVERIHLMVEADLPGVSDETFSELTEQARALCAISKILKIPITLESTRTTIAAPTEH